MTNPFNPEAGATPFPVDPLEVRVTREAAKLMWRACPYFEWRYGKRGRAFGLSDAGFLVTLAWAPVAAIDQQLDWHTRLLVPRGMPSVLMELQLEILGRVGRKLEWSDHQALASAAQRRRQTRAKVLSDVVLRSCEQSFRANTRGLPHAVGTGLLIAGAVADARMGIGEHEHALVDWLVGHGPSQARWREACRACLEQAQASPLGAVTSKPA